MKKLTAGLQERGITLQRQGELFQIASSLDGFEEKPERHRTGYPLWMCGEGELEEVSGTASRLVRQGYRETERIFMGLNVHARCVKEIKGIVRL